MKRWLFYIFAILVFGTISVVYMSSELDNKVIIANDYVSWRGARQELSSYTEQTGENSWWTGSMFSGMPNYQIGGGSCFSLDLMKPLNFVTHYGCNNSPIVMVFLYMLGFFAVLLAFRVNKMVAVVGAIAMAFSSYFFIIIGAGHNSKTAALGLFAFVLAGQYCIYNNKRILGACLTMLFVATGFYPHPQMAYYYCFILGVFFLAELWKHKQTGKWKTFAISSCIFVASFLVGLGTGFANFFANTEYMSETMRGGHSDLVKESDAENKTKGLDLDYATAWSYGIDETFTFLVPNYMGGSSNYNVGEKSDLYETMKKNGLDTKTAKQFCQNTPAYWGDQPFTSGPVYMGAVVCFLFVLGLFIVKGPYKWALLCVTILSVMLSWGHNFMPLTKLFFSIMPMYNKFRAVSSILIIAEITIPLLGFLALKRISDGSMNVDSLKKSIRNAAIITGGLCLLLLVVGGVFFDFSSPMDERTFSRLPEWLSSAIVEQRGTLFFHDCWRSFIFVALAAALTWFFATNKNFKLEYFAVALGALVLADLWPVDKRYMNDSAFSPEKNLKAYFKKKPYEEQMLQDTTHFRVLNLASNTFNEARTSYYFKSIGGYSAAKLRRYQDLIDQHIAPEFNPLFSALSSTGGRLELCDGDSLFPVLNMLNAKYFVVPLQNKEEVAIQNPHAMGNAWFVSNVKCVRNANEECDALATENLRDVAVVDKQFDSYVNGRSFYKDSLSSIELTKYTPEYIDYKSNSSQDGLAVFSEIYYPYGWKAYIDGEYKEHFRVDYMLRALSVPAGEHTIRFVFAPDSIVKGDVISSICTILMYLFILGSVVWCFIRRKNGDDEGNDQFCESVTR